MPRSGSRREARSRRLPSESRTTFVRPKRARTVAVGVEVVHALLGRVLDVLDGLLAAAVRREHLADLDGRQAAHVDVDTNETVVRRGIVRARIFASGDHTNN